MCADVKDSLVVKSLAFRISVDRPNTTHKLAAM